MTTTAKAPSKFQSADDIFFLMSDFSRQSSYSRILEPYMEMISEEKVMLSLLLLMNNLFSSHNFHKTTLFSNPMMSRPHHDQLLWVIQCHVFLKRPIESKNRKKLGSYSRRKIRKMVSTLDHSQLQVNLLTFCSHQVRTLEILRDNQEFNPSRTSGLTRQLGLNVHNQMSILW